MQIDLNKSEIELLDRALESWERDPMGGALMSSVFASMLCPKDEREANAARREVELCKAQEESTQRRIKSILLRAKLYQALSRESEHDLEAK